MKMRMLEDYEKAKRVSIGEKIACPFCKKIFIKNTYNKIFCSNIKTNKKKNCKDAFWNKADPQKRCRKNKYYYNNIYKEDYEEHPFSSEGLGQWLD